MLSAHKSFVFFVIGILMTIVVRSQHLHVLYNAPWGVSQLKYDDQELINLNKRIGLPMVVESYKTIKKNKEARIEWSSPIAYNWNEKTNEWTLNTSWGTAVCKYQQVRDTLFMKVTVTNTSEETFCGVSISLLTLNIGKKPYNFNVSYSSYANNITAPAVIYANTDQYRLIVENPEANKKVYVGIMEQSGSNGTLYRIWSGTRPYTGMTDFDEASEIRLAPKQSYSYTVAARFCKPNTAVAVAAQKSYDAFRLRQPFKALWKDKRPIGSLFLASYTNDKNPLNPRKWSLLSGSNNNITTAAGLDLFRKNVLAFADKSITYLKSMNAQGMITWDVEGQEYPHPFSYIGSPELVGKLAPEMSAVADEYFNRFKKAGFKTGICIRPDSVVFSGNWIEHVAVKDPAATLIRKIAYARKRWGCTLFYIDTNIDPATGQVMHYSVFKKVNEKFPDVLLIPEHERTMHYCYTAPYEDMQSGALLINESIKSAYPEAFMVISVPGGLKGREQEDIKNLVDCLDQGNILLFRAWFEDEPTNSIIKKAMSRSRYFKTQ